MSILATPKTIDKSQPLEDAFHAFNQISKHLTDSYQHLEQQVGVLSDALAQSNSEKIQYLSDKETLATQLEGLIEAIPGAVIVLDAQLKVIKANACARNWLHDDILGLNWTAVRADCLICHDEFTDQYSLKGGQIVALSTTKLGVQTGKVVLLSDITQQQELYQQVEHKKKLAEMGAFSASLAHQIRTPLASALLYASQLTTNALSEQAQQKCSAKLLDRLRVLDSQVTDMLSYSHCGEFVKQTIKLTSFIDRLESLYYEKRIDFHAGCFHEPVEINVNQDALIGAIGNLLDNALDAIGVDEHVLCSIELVDERVLIISVKDQGIGLSGDQQQKIFEPFYTNKTNGTGLGLAVVQQVVNAHAGDINCVSTLGVGTEIAIRLPVLILPLRKQSNRSL